METKEKLKQLRELMAREGISACYIPTSDFHDSEYVGEYFKGRAWLSGFSGSAGVLVVTMDEAHLWTDGRYFIQAEEQLAGSTIHLMKMQEPGVPTVTEYLSKTLNANDVLAFDGRCVSAQLVKTWQQQMPKVEFRLDVDVFDMIWTDRPGLPSDPAFMLDDAHSGKPMGEKLADVRKAMAERGAQWHLLTTLDDIAWLFNLRGNDVLHSPVVLSYALLSQEEAYLFADEAKFDASMKEVLNQNHVQLCPYFEVYDRVAALQGKVLLEASRVNALLVSRIHEVLEGDNPTTLMKAIKNATELKNTRHAHVKDGAAVTKFMIWLKEAVKHETITEISASDQLEAFRREQADFIELSFSTIAAYKEHAALMHYSATPESDVELRPEGMLLVDSGGTYLDGTTDITRTFVLGEVSEEIKRHYTAVLRGMIDLSMAKFLKGCIGINLDILARGPVWQLGIDYRCGTGHGVGHILNVHEGPHGIRWRLTPTTEKTPLEAGMVVTNEPGIYEEGRHGIRIENELIVCEDETNEYGTFLNFETMTLAPIDLDAVLVDELTKAERDFLNAYHQRVAEAVAPFMNEEELAMLKVYTREI